jgi:glycerophosphoryl diester phosphodiesterase
MIIWITFSALAMEPAAPMIVAHRGASADAPENTLAAFELAWKLGADAIECDVWMTEDGHLVCIHDNRTGGKHEKDIKITESTLQEIQQLNLGVRFGDKWKDEKIPLLSDVLLTVPEHGTIYIEVKDSARVLPALKKLLDDTALKDQQITLISFNQDVIKQAGDILPEIKNLLLLNIKYNKGKQRWEPNIDEVLSKLADTGARGLDVKASEYIDKSFISKLKANDAECHIWTVNDPESAVEFWKLGVKSITTDKPDTIKSALSKTINPSDRTPQKEQ